MIQILNVVIRKGKNPHSYGSKQAGYTPGGTCVDPKYSYILGKEKIKVTLFTTFVVHLHGLLAEILLS